MESKATHPKELLISAQGLRRCFGMTVLMIANDLILREPSVFVDSLTTNAYSLFDVRFFVNVAFIVALLVTGVYGWKIKNEVSATKLLHIQLGAGLLAAAIVTVIACFAPPQEMLQILLGVMFVLLGLFAAFGLLFWVANLTAAELRTAWLEIIISLFLSSLGYVYILYASEPFSALELFFGVYILSAVLNIMYNRKQPHVPAVVNSNSSAKSFIGLGKTYGPTVVCISALNYVLIASRMFLAHISTNAINAICGAGICLSAIALFLTYFTKQNTPKMKTLYEIAFPFIALAFLLLPFASDALKGVFMLAATTVGTMGSTLLIYLALQVRASASVSAVGTYGIASGFMHVALFLGFIGGGIGPGDEGANIIRYSVFALILVYVFLLIFILCRHKPIEQEAQAGVVFVSSHESLDQTCIQLQEAFALTPREVEVLKGLVHGQSITSIAAHFHISESTARTHSKNLYKKLNIHSKSELIELLANTNCENSNL